MRHAQGGVAHLARLFTEDGAQQALLRGQLSLALGRYFANENVAGAHFGADPDHAVFIEVLERVFRHVRDLAGDLFAAKLCLAGLLLVFLYVDRRVYVVLDQPFVDEDRVLIVIALPGHEPDQDVAAERQLSVVGGWAVGQHFSLPDALARAHNGPLVHAGALVGANKFGEPVRRCQAAVAEHFNLTRGHVGDDSVFLGDDAHARVQRGLVLHAGADNGGLRADQGHGLPLHVRTHQGAVCVVVFQKRNHGRRDRNDHLGRNIHVIGALAGDFHNLLAVAGGDFGIEEAAVLADGLVGLRHNEFILAVGGHVLHFVEHDAGLLINFAVGSLQKAVLIDTRIA